MLAIAKQLSPLSTKWNALQLSTIPGWVGLGVEIPLPGVVVVVMVDVVKVVGDGVVVGEAEPEP